MGAFESRLRVRGGLAVGIVAAMIGLSCGTKDQSGAPASDSTRVAAPIPTDTNARRTILFVGTSLTAGYGLDPDSAYSQLIQRKIDAARLPFETVNAGVSGETTAGLVQRLDWILRAKFDVLIIESGANDGLRGVPADAIQKNLIEVVRRAREGHPDALILLIQMEALPNYGRQYGSAFRAIYSAVASETKVQLLPFLLDGVAGRPELNQGDGIHPNYDGERIVASNVWRGLEPALRARLR